MVPENEIVITFDVSGRVVLMVEIAWRKIRFVQRSVINEDTSFPNTHPVPRKAHHPLDVRLRGVQRIEKDDNVASLDLLKTVEELVDEDSLVIHQPGHHTGPFHLHRLVQEYNHNEGEKERKDKIS